MGGSFSLQKYLFIRVDVECLSRECNNVIARNAIVNGHYWLLLLHRPLRKNITAWFVYRRALLHVEHMCFAKCSPRRFYTNLWESYCRVPVRTLASTTPYSRTMNYSFGFPCVRVHVKNKQPYLPIWQTLTSKKFFFIAGNCDKKDCSTGIKGLIHSFI